MEDAGVPTQPGQQPGGIDQIEALIRDLIEKDVAKFLKDRDAAAKAVEWLHTETGLPKWQIGIAIRLLAPLLEAGAKAAGKAAAQAGGKWLWAKGVAAAKSALARLPYSGDAISALRRFAEKLAKSVDDRKLYEDILAGRRPTGDRTLTTTLSNQEKADLAQLAASTEIKAALDGLKEELGGTLADILETLHPQPPLYLGLVDRQNLSGINRFVYSVQRVPFLGRQDDIGRLSRFLDDNQAFLWWIVEGSAGTGKSRLALELCLRKGEAWRAGFLKSPADFSHWNDWQPKRPTLIVFDYVEGNADALRDLIHRLHNRRAEFAWPVRLLLLERKAAGGWWDMLLAQGSTEGVAVEAASHAPPLSPAQLTDDDLWAIVKALHDEAEKQCQLPREAVLQRLREIDLLGRPLLAAFAGDALVETGKIEATSLIELLRGVLRREKQKRWNPAGVTGGHERLLALVTMTGKIAAAKLRAHPIHAHLPQIEQSVLDIFRVMSGLLWGANDVELLPLEPDILGELFVLDHVQNEMTVAPDVADSLKLAAWQLDDSGVFMFLTRSARDFPGHLGLTQAGAPIHEPVNLAFGWAQAAVNMILLRGDAGFVKEARSLYDAIAGLARDHDEPALRAFQARGAVHLIIIYGMANRPDDAHALYNALADLARDHDEPALREFQAKGASNLIILIYSKANRPDGARALYDAIASLARDHDEPVLREVQAKGADNLIIIYGMANRLDEARTLYDAIADLAHDHDEPVLREVQASGAIKLINAYGTADRPDDARALYDTLAGLARDHDEPALHEEQAKGAFNLITGYGNAGRLDDARALYDALASLARDHDQPALRELQAKGAVNLINSYGNAGRTDEARALYDALAGLARDHDEPALRERLAQGAFNLISDYGRANRPDEARALYDALAGLARDYDESALRELQANGAVSLIAAYGTANRPDDARALYDAIAGLARAHDEPALREFQAKGAVNLISAYGDANRLDEARALYDDLAGLARDHDEPALREVQANGAFNMLVNIAREKRPQDEAMRYIDDIASIAKALPNSAVVQDIVRRLQPPDDAPDKST